MANDNIQQNYLCTLTVEANINWVRTFTVQSTEKGYATIVSVEYSYVYSGSTRKMPFDVNVLLARKAYREALLIFSFQFSGTHFKA